MSAQPEALRMADALDAGENFYAESSLWYDQRLSDAVGEAAAELRRLHEVNQELLEALKEITLEHGMTEKARAAIAKATGETK